MRHELIKLSIQRDTKGKKSQIAQARGGYLYRNSLNVDRCIWSLNVKATYKKMLVYVITKCTAHLEPYAILNV